MMKRDALLLMSLAAVFFLGTAVLVSGCFSHQVEEVTLHRGEVPHGVLKFTDGPVTCYVIGEHGISCLAVLQ